MPTGNVLLNILLSSINYFMLYLKRNPRSLSYFDPVNSTEFSKWNKPTLFEGININLLLPSALLQDPYEGGKRRGNDIKKLHLGEVK